MKKFGVILFLLFASFSINVFGKLKDLRDSLNTIVINKAGHKLKAFRYLDYTGEPKVEVIPENDTLKIRNSRGIINFQGMGSQFMTSYCTLYPGDTIYLNVESNRLFISAINKQLQAKIEMLKSLSLSMGNNKSEMTNDFNTSTGIISDSNTRQKQIIESYKNKIDARTFQEATAIVNYNFVDSLIRLHTRFMIKSDSIFSLKVDSEFAWNYLAFGKLSYHYLEYFRNVHHLSSADSLTDLVNRKLPPSIADYVVFNYLNNYTHDSVQQLDTLTKLTANYVRTSHNKILIDKLELNLKDVLDRDYLRNSSGLLLINAATNKPLNFTSLISQYKNKIIYLDFWASWCAPCLAEIPISKKKSDALTAEKKEVIFLYLSEDTNPTEWRVKASELGLPPNRSYLLLKNDARMLFFKKYAIQFIPRYMIVDKKGVIVNADAPHPTDIQLRNTLLMHLK